MERHHEESIRKAVRERYGSIAMDGHPLLNAAPPMSCCSKSSKPLNELSKHMGYSEEQLVSVPEGANMGLSCGNPVGIAGVRPGETVLDLGAGGGFTGGVLVLGALLGRDKGLEDLKDCGLLIKDLKKRFLKEFGSVNCGAMLKGFNETQKPFMCAKITAKGAEMVVELLNEYEKERAQDLSTLCCRPRDKVALGTCPFGATC